MAKKISILLKKITLLVKEMIFSAWEFSEAKGYSNVIPP